jgi:hypothetical protein
MRAVKDHFAPAHVALLACVAAAVLVIAAIVFSIPILAGRRATSTTRRSRSRRQCS